MRLLGRMEVRVDAEVNLHRAVAEPGAAAPGQRIRFWHFGQAEHAAVERARQCLPAGRHREQDVIDGHDSHAWRAYANVTA
jgi:hypothetical protein